MTWPDRIEFVKGKKAGWDAAHTTNNPRFIAYGSG